MITVSIVTREQVGDRIGVDVILRDEGTSGVGLVQVLDGSGLLLHEDHLGCRAAGTTSVPLLPAAVFPLTVRAQDCEGATTETEPFDLLPPGGDPEVGVPVDCTPLECVPTDACTRAVGDLTRLRRAIVDECARLSAAIDHVRDLEQTAAGLAALGASLLFAAADAFGIPFFGLVLFAILAAAALAALTAATVTLVRADAERRKLGSLRAVAREGLADFPGVLEEVNRKCCAGCVVADLSVPPCPL